MEAVISKDEMITDVHDFYSYVLMKGLDDYDGKHCETMSATMVSTTNPNKISFYFSDFVECKAFEAMIKPYCTNFKPKLFGYDKSPIKVPKELKQELKKLKKGNESFVDVIWKLLVEHYGVE